MNKGLFNFNLFMTMVTLYMMPIKSFPQIWGLQIDELLFSAVIIFNVFYIIVIGQRFAIWELLFMIFILYRVVYLKDLNAIVLFSIIITSRMVRAYSDNQRILNESFLKIILVICVIFTFIYSMLYAGTYGRFAYTGHMEANISGFSILFLALLVRRYYKTLSIAIFLLGLLTISRSYLLAIILLIIVPYLVKLPIGNIIYRHLRSFVKVTFITSFALILIALFFTGLYNAGKVTGSGLGLNRLFTFFDYSNYLRFKVNTNLINLYIMDPLMLIRGFSSEEFMKLSVNYSNSNGEFMKAIKPHNFFYSYSRIYGVFSILIMFLISKIITPIITLKNFSIYITLISYSVILGVGFNSYFLILSAITLLIYKTDREAPKWKMN